MQMTRDICRTRVQENQPVSSESVILQGVRSLLIFEPRYFYLRDTRARKCTVVSNGTREVAE